MYAENLPNASQPNHPRPVAGAAMSESLLAVASTSSCEQNARSMAAGWFDGHRAGRVATHRDLCLTLADWELTLDDDDAVVSGCRLDTLRDESPVGNEGADEAWAEGYENGFAAARQRIVSNVRAQLAARSLFLSDGLCLLTAADASDCVDGLASIESPRSENVPPASQPRDEEGVWSMVVRTFTRRAAIFVLGGTLLVGSLGFVGASQFMRPTPPPPPPSWTAPTTWDADFPFVKQMLLTIDQNAWNLEQAEGSPSASLLAQMQGIFAMPGANGDVGRALLCRWVAERHKTQYIAPLITQLNPTLSSVKTREAIVGCVAFTHADGGTVLPMHRQMLQSYMTSCAEDDETVWMRLEHLINDLVAAGI